MKTILEQLEAVKLTAITAIDEMEKAQAEPDRIYNMIAETEDLDDKVALWEKWEVARKNRKYAVIKARLRVVAYADFIGIQFNKDLVKYGFNIKKQFYHIADYADEIARQIARVQDIYRDLHF